jgi:hypothetical protein
MRLALFSFLVSVGLWLKSVPFKKIGTRAKRKLKRALRGQRQLTRAAQLLERSRFSVHELDCRCVMTPPVSPLRTVGIVPV